MTTVVSQISKEQMQRAIRELREFVAIPSLSNINNADYNRDSLNKAAAFACEKLKELGFLAELVYSQDSPPFVIAERKSSEADPTILLYGHYDVQPVEIDKWKTAPFVMEERDGRLYGRGTSDDKGGIVGILTALRYFEEAKLPLPVNIKILFEGEEEYGSGHMGSLLKEQAERLQAEALIVLDGANPSVDKGTLSSSARGLANLRVKVKALAKPCHSGLGCLAPDPAQGLAQLICSLKDPHQIPEIMAGHEALKEGERNFLRKNSQTVEAYAAEVNVLPGMKLRGKRETSIYERLFEYPSISIVNMKCGIPDGGNSIQDEAWCIVNVRTLPGQDSKQIGDKVAEYLRQQELSYGLKAEVSLEEHASPWRADFSGIFAQKYFDALSEIFGRVDQMPCGGTLPLLKEFRDNFPNMEILVPGVEDSLSSAHSHNESLHIGLLEKSINSLIVFLQKLAKK